VVPDGAVVGRWTSPLPGRRLRSAHWVKSRRRARGPDPTVGGDCEGQRDHGGHVLPAAGHDGQCPGGVERRMEQAGGQQAAAGVDEDRPDQVAEERGADQKDGPGDQGVAP